MATLDTIQTRIKGDRELRKSMTKWSALGAVVAIPVPVIGPVFGAIAGATYAYLKKKD